MKTILFCAVLASFLFRGASTRFHAYEPPQKPGKTVEQPAALPVVAYVMEVKSAVMLLRGSQPPRELTTKNNRGMPLLAADKLKFDTKGAIMLRYYTADKKPVTRTFGGSGATYTITRPASKPPAWERNLVDQMGHIGGSEMAGDTLFIAPARDSIMRIDHFTIKWKVPAMPHTMAFQVLAGVSQDTWRSGDVPANSGALPAKELQDLKIQLKTWGASKDRLKVQVLLLTSAHDTDTTSFTLMSGAEEKRLAADLTRWHALESDPLLYQMGTAQILSGYGLRNEAADAWDAALARAPDSRFVREKTQDAHRQVNDVEADETQKRSNP